MKKQILLKLKTIIFTIVIICLPTSRLFAESIAYKWVKGLSAVGSHVNLSINSMQLDAYGHVYITGYYSGTVDFDLSSATHNLISNGNSDIFIAKYDSLGNYIWAKNIGGTRDDIGGALYLDYSGTDIYITGQYTNTVDFDPGAANHSLNALPFEAFTFIAKYDSACNYIWAKDLKSASHGYIGTDIMTLQLDSLENIYLSGVFSGTIDFDPGAGIDSLSGAGILDIFMAKYDSSGNYIWAESIGNENFEFLTSSQLDKSGNLYTTGWFQDTVDFDPGSAINNLIALSSVDLFIAKYDSAGNYQWAKSIGDPNSQYNIMQLRLDSLGNSYIIGYFSDTLDFDPGIVIHNLISKGSIDLFIAKYDPAGNYVWAKSIGGINPDYGSSIYLDASRNIYITGTFSGTVDFDPGLGEQYLSTLNSAIFIAKYDSAGNYILANRIGGGGYAESLSIQVDVSKNIYIHGQYNGTIDFDPGMVTHNLTSVNDIDLFIAKYGYAYCTTDHHSINASICYGDSYTFPDGVIADNDTVYYAYYTNMLGCDSIITSALTVNPIYNSSEHYSICAGDNFLFPDGISLIITKDTIKVSNLTAVTSCDSTITTTLSVTTVNTSVGVSGTTLTAAATGVTYQWVDCNNGYAPLSGKIAKSYVANNNGSYAVIVTKNSCSDTSTCYLITNSGIAENFLRVVQLVPNPAKDKVIFKIDNYNNEHLKLEVMDGIGQLIENRMITSSNTELDLRNYSNGIYLVRCSNNEGLFYWGKLFVDK